MYEDSAGIIYVFQRTLQEKRQSLTGSTTLAKICLLALKVRDAQREGYYGIGDSTVEGWAWGGGMITRGGMGLGRRYVLKEGGMY